jgi:hypothetical protein
MTSWDNEVIEKSDDVTRSSKQVFGMITARSLVKPLREFLADLILTANRQDYKIQLVVSNQERYFKLKRKFTYTTTNNTVVSFQSANTNCIKNCLEEMLMGRFTIEDSYNKTWYIYFSTGDTMETSEVLEEISQPILPPLQTPLPTQPPLQTPPLQTPPLQTPPPTSMVPPLAKPLPQPVAPMKIAEDSPEAAKLNNFLSCVVQHYNEWAQNNLRRGATSYSAHFSLPDAVPAV